jgi:hypothetical protein
VGREQSDGVGAPGPCLSACGAARADQLVPRMVNSVLSAIQSQFRQWISDLDSKEDHLKIGAAAMNEVLRRRPPPRSRGTQDL